MSVVLFATGLLASAPFNRVSNRFLALLMMAIALWVLDGFFRVSGLYGQNADLYFLPISTRSRSGRCCIPTCAASLNTGFGGGCGTGGISCRCCCRRG